MWRFDDCSELQEENSRTGATNTRAHKLVRLARLRSKAQSSITARTEVRQLLRPHEALPSMDELAGARIDEADVWQRRLVHPIDQAIVLCSV